MSSRVPSELRTARSFTLGYWDKVGLLLAWFALPFIVPFVLSQFIQPFFLSRYLIGVSPAWHIAVALGLRNWCNGRPLPAALGTLLIMAVIMPSTIKAYKPPWKPDWRGAVAYLDEHVPRRGQVLFPASWESQSYLYYTRRDDVRLLPSKEPAADILDDAQIWFISTDVCPTRLRRQSVQGCADLWKVRRAWDSASSAMPRQQSLCGDHADADPELGVLVETRRFYNVSVCRYQQELE